MLSTYNTLRQKYIVDGYAQSYNYILQLQQQQQNANPNPNSIKISQCLLTNLYCYIIIQEQFKSEQILAILDNCLTSEEGTKIGAMRALTLYHVASVYFKMGEGKADGHTQEYEKGERDTKDKDKHKEKEKEKGINKWRSKCKEVCQRVLKQFLGVFYSLQMRLQKTKEERELGLDLQEILYYTFLMLAYLAKREGTGQARSMLEAARRIIKDRKDVMSLTAKTTFSKDQSIPGTPQTSSKKGLEKQNLSLDVKNQLKHTKSLQV